MPSSKADCKSGALLHAVYNDKAFRLAPYYHAVTIKGTSKDNYYTEEQLYEQLQKLGNKRREIEIKSVTYELDSHNRLHAHALIRCKNFYAPQRKGWHIDDHSLDTIEDVDSWLRYMHKGAYNDPSQDQIFTLNYLYNHKIFI